MTDAYNCPYPPAANDNVDPFLHADTGLAEMYLVRAQMLARDLGVLTLDERMRHYDALRRLDKVIRSYLAYL